MTPEWGPLDGAALLASLDADSRADVEAALHGLKSGLLTPADMRAFTTDPRVDPWALLDALEWLICSRGNSS